MGLPATVHVNELRRVADSTYVNRNFKVCLVDAPGSTFDNDDPFATIMANEVTVGLGGYARQQIGYSAADIGLLEAGKLPFARKAAIFTHNGAANQAIRFSHVVVLTPAETGITCVRKLATNRATLSDSQAAIFYFDLSLYGVFVAS